MNDDTKSFIFMIIVIVTFFIAVVILALIFDNASQRSKCESLREQGVKVYIADKILSQECIILQRELK